ncbi:MAG TPA: VIT domain-containing protein [Tepidisphaeraceae bacterium]|jgi:Ca-activated chloride channel family protein|nr:VIT domain-containing protein [Tepidisphaeraceae bacterium]
MDGTKAGQRIAFTTRNPADRIALRGVHLHARAAGMSCKATLEQTFVNLEPRAIEAVYTFPLPEGAAVCGFEVITADHVLTGAVEEANQAIEKYENAIDEGHGAFLMEQERPDVFTVRVGNLKPRQAATIRITWVCPLERVDKSIRMAFPTTVAPRYSTATATDPLDAAIDSDALNPPHVLSVPYGLSIEVDVALGRELKRVSSPSHAIKVVNGDDATCRVSFTGGVAEMDRDVVILLELAREQQPCVQTARGREGESYLAVTFVPEFDEDELVEPRPTETIFVLDCSGSMQGESIQQATAALELCLRSLSAGDRFNICRFGSTWELMSSEPLAYTQATLDLAVQYVRQSRDLGGTELHAPLEAILSGAPTAGPVRQIILLTDGQVTNEPALVELARRHRTHNRIFSFGIGAASSAFLVKGIARATGGAAEFITAGERIDDKVLRTFGRLASPQVTDVQIDWDGCDVQTLAEIPPVFDGDVLCVFGRAPARLPAKVTLHCMTATGPRKWSVAAPPPLEDDGVIATMWARRTIQSLEEVNGVMHGRGRALVGGREREMLIALSKQYRLLCSLTTFVSIEHRSLAERNEGQPALRRVPVKLAKEWGAVAGGTVLRKTRSMGAHAAARAVDADLVGLEEDIEGCLDLSRSADDTANGAAVGGSSGDPNDTTLCAVLDEIPPAESTQRPTPANVPPPNAGAKDRRGLFAGIAAVFKGTPSQTKEFVKALKDSGENLSAEPLLWILAAQRADGSFRWKGSPPLGLQRGIDKWAKAVTAALPPLAKGAEREAVVTTVAAILIMERRFTDREPVWRRAYRKACREFLTQALNMNIARVEKWLAEIRE